MMQHNIAKQGDHITKESEARTPEGKELHFNNTFDSGKTYNGEMPPMEDNRPLNAKIEEQKVVALFGDKRNPLTELRQRNDEKVVCADARLSANDTRSTSPSLMDPRNSEVCLSLTGIENLKYMYLLLTCPEELGTIRSSITLNHQNVTVSNQIAVNCILKGQDCQAAYSEMMTLFEKAFQNLEFRELQLENLNSQILERIKRAYHDLYVFTDCVKPYIVGEREKVYSCLQFCTNMQSIPTDTVTIGRSQTSLYTRQNDIQEARPVDFDKSTKPVTVDNENSKSHIFDSNVLRYLQEIKHSEYNSATKNCNATSVNDGDSENCVLTLRGKQTEIDNSMEQIFHLLQNVKLASLKYSGSTLQVDQIEERVNESEYNNTYLRIDRSKQQMVIVTDEQNVTFVKSKLKEKLHISNKTSKVVPSEQPMRRGKLPENITTSNDGEIKFEFLIAEGINVTIMQHDITTMNVDAIVNAANANLDHGGGVALAIAKAAGSSFVEKCNDEIQKYGMLRVGQCFTTQSWDLNAYCKYIINAVGPCIYEYRNRETTCYRDLKSTFVNILQEAENKKITTVAMPLISSGLYGVPREKCAQMLFEALVNFSQTHTVKNYLRQIYLSNFDEETTSVITEVFKKELNLDPGDSCCGVPSETTSDGLREHNGPLVCFACNKNVVNKCKWSYMKCKHVCCKTCKDFLELDVKSECFACLDTTGETTAYNYKKPVERTLCCDRTVDTSLPCKHRYCQDCVENTKTFGPKCQECRHVFGVIRGPQPEYGNMWYYEDKRSLPGYDKLSTIVIHYEFSNGVQNKLHPNPGKTFIGIKRKAYLPATNEGWEVLNLLKNAFDAGHIFTVGTSGQENVVTWNDIHHKTSVTGGLKQYGYPDPGYIARVKRELADKGFCPESLVEETMI